MMNLTEELAVDGTQGISWVIDGIVLQHAGELLFDIAETSAARTLGRSIYLACLEDFAFAIVYGESFFTPGALIQVGGEFPGEVLADRFHFMRRQPSGEGVSISPDDLLKTPIYRERITEDLLHLANTLTIGKAHWEHWIVREARVYLGNHSSLFDRDCNVEELQFGKFPPYACDKDLQAKIPRKLVDHLVGCLSHVYQGYSRAVLEEFVQRCVLTLDVISWWYDAQSTKISSGIRLPFSVRSLIKQSPASVGKVGPKRRFVRDILVRHALADIVLLNNCRTRSDVIDRLAVVHYQEPYITLRKHWLDLEYELEGGGDKGIDQLIHDIRKCAELGGLRPVDVQCDRETLDDGHRTTIRRALRNLVPYEEQKYEARMGQIFPELVGDSNGKDRVMTMPPNPLPNQQPPFRQALSGGDSPTQQVKPIRPGSSGVKITIVQLRLFYKVGLEFNRGAKSMTEIGKTIESEKCELPYSKSTLSKACNAAQDFFDEHFNTRTPLFICEKPGLPQTGLTARGHEAWTLTEAYLRQDGSLE